MRRILDWIFIATLPFGIAFGCADDRTSYCEAKIDCEDGTRDDLESCEAMLDYQKETADNCGCSDLYDDWLACLRDEGTCESGTWELSEGDAGATWETSPDGAGHWVTPASCTERANALYLCETDS